MASGLSPEQLRQQTVNRTGARARAGETEFGGGPGPIQTAAAGHVMDAGEKARVLRTYGIRTESGEQRLDGAVDVVGAARRDEAAVRVGGRIAGEGL